MFSVHFSPMQQTAQNNVRKNMAGIAQTTLRLSTGKRINSAKDDPAGFIATEMAKSENASIRANLKTTRQYGSKLAVLDSYLASLGNLLIDIKGSVVEGANSGALSEEERNALQSQIDYALDSIDRIVRTASYQGEKLLEGLFGTTVDLSGFPTVSELQSSPSEFQFSLDLLNAKLDSTSSTSIPDQTQTVRTDSLSKFMTLFSGQEEKGGLFSDIASLLGRLSLTTGETATEEIPDATEEETSEGQVTTEDTDQVENIESTETDQEEKVETVTADSTATESTDNTEDSVLEQFLAEERERDLPAADESNGEGAATEESALIAENDESTQTTEAESAETTPMQEVSAKEESSDQVQEEGDKEEPYAGLLYGDPDGYGGYVFTQANPLDFYHTQEPEKEEPAVRFEIEFSLESIRENLTRNLMNDALSSSMTTMRNPTEVSASCSDGCVSTTEKDSENEKEKNGKDETGESSSETDWIKGVLADLRSGGSASLKNDPSKADKIIDQAISTLAFRRAAVGAEMKYTVEVDIEMLENRLFHNERFQQMMSDADFAVESANLARYQILLQTSMKALEFTRDLPKMMLDLLHSSTPSRPANPF